MTDFTLEHTAPVERTTPVHAATRAERLAARLLQFGAIAVVLVVSTYRIFELDRFFVPKELVLHASAALAGFLAIRAVGRSAFGRIDLLLALYLLVSTASAALSANPWAAGRALAISVSSVAIFWTARALGTSGLRERILTAIALAVVVAAITSLAQAYGLRLDVFSINRAPGGTLGNRNFVGHAAAFGLPIVLYAALRARNAGRFLLASAGAAIVAAALVLTRSRGAWLAAAIVTIVIFAGVLAARALRSDGRTWGRLLVLAIVIAAAGAAALTIPNTLRWRSDNPYVESVQGIAAFDEGSGRGRLIQYERSLRMTLAHPLLGVGPGNWPVVYPDYAARRDPSMNPAEGGMTYNPWPSSDWIAFLSERGPVAAALLGFAMLSIALAGLRRLVAANSRDDALLAIALVATIAGAAVAGAFDAVLLLALPSFLVWAAAGALFVPADTSPHEPQRGRAVPLLLMLLIATAAAAGAVRSATQIVAMDLYAIGGGRDSLRQAAILDPGNYRVRIRLARGGSREERCRNAQAARALYPTSQAAANAARRCE